LAAALAYCHDHRIYHRDIKPENLLLDENYQLKVADFGLAAIRADPEELLRTECGTRSYMAPEVLARQQYDGSKADCWSAGVVLFIMLSGNPPFQMARPGDWWFNQFRDGRPDKFWRSHRRYTPAFPEGAQEMLTRVFQPDPSQRPSVKDLLQEPWLTSCQLTPQDVKKELQARKERIIKEKENEKERARRKKAAGQHGASGTTRDFDPDKVKHRDVAGGDGLVDTHEISLEEAGPKPPSAPQEALDGVTNLYTAEGGRYSLKRVREAIELMGGAVQAKAKEDEGNDFKLVATVPYDAMNKVEVEVKVWSVEDGDITLIQVLRKMGDPLGFQTAFKKLRKETIDLHGEQEEANPVIAVGPQPYDSDDEEATPAGPVEEQPLEEGVDMI